MARSLFFSVTLAIWVVAASCARYHDLASSPSPFSSAPSADCSTVIYDMVDCISYLSEGSSEPGPSQSCCTGFQSVLAVDDKCLCFAIENSAAMGIELNISRAAMLGSACGVSAPPISRCGISLTPAEAPGNPPMPSPELAPSSESPKPSSPVPSTPAPSLSPGTKGGEDNQAPAPTASGTLALSISLAHLISMLVASFTYMSA